MNQRNSTESMQAAVQAASDHLADTLLDGGDTKQARAELNKARAEQAAHLEAEQAAEREQRAEAEVRNVDELAKSQAAAIKQSVTEVAAAIASIQLPDGVEAASVPEHPLVTAAAAEVAQIQHQIEQASPQNKAAADEAAALASRAKDKRAQANAIRSRRAAGKEAESDAADMHLLESDATDLDSMAQAAEARSRDLSKPIAILRANLAVAEHRLKAAKAEAALHGQADRVRALEAAFIEAVRVLRANTFTPAGYANLPHFYRPSPEVRAISYGQAV